MGVNGEALQLHPVYKSHILYYKSHENSYQVLQVLDILPTQGVHSASFVQTIIVQFLHTINTLCWPVYNPAVHPMKYLESDVMWYK